jgi:D-alanine-D-alanine ligase
LVHDPSSLNAAVRAVVEQYRQDALVEEYIDGREICIGLLGNDPVEFLPPVELDFSDRELRLMTWDDKYHQRTDEPRKVCPARLDDALRNQLNELALATFRACRLRDYARVDIRLDHSGRPFVLEINSMASLGEGGSYMTAAKSAGYDFPGLVNKIVDVAHRRYFGLPAPCGVQVAVPASLGVETRLVAVGA